MVSTPGPDRTNSPQGLGDEEPAREQSPGGQSEIEAPRRQPSQRIRQQPPRRAADQPAHPVYRAVDRCDPCIERRSRCDRAWPSCGRCVREGTTDRCYGADDIGGDGDDAGDDDGENPDPQPARSPVPSTARDSPRQASPNPPRTPSQQGRHSRPVSVPSVASRRSASPRSRRNPASATPPAASVVSGRPGAASVQEDLLRVAQEELAAAQARVLALQAATPGKFLHSAFMHIWLASPCHSSPHAPASLLCHS
jgi:hypothetical protein